MDGLPPSAAEAAARAREIAAKLLGTTAPLADLNPPASSSTAGTTERKRKRWGVAPATSTGSTASATGGGGVVPGQFLNHASTNGALLPGLETMAAKMKADQEPVQRRLWITGSLTKERPAWHFVTYMAPKFDAIRQQVVREEAAEQNKPKEELPALKIEFKGRGATKTPVAAGIPLEPFHVFLEGSPSMADAAENLIEELLQEAEKADVTVDITEEDLLDVAAAAAAAAHAGGHNDQLALGYRPATVAQLIGGVDHHNNLLPQEQWPSEDIHVPNGVVGFIIGRGGETITSLQARTGAKVQIQKEHEVQPGQTMRIITVSAQTQDQVDQCKIMIESMVDDRVRAAGGTTSTVGTAHGGFMKRNSAHTSSGPAPQSKDSMVQQAVSEGHVLKTVDVPDADVGLIIGKGGATIHDIQGRTQASIQIPPAGNPDNPAVRTVSITCPSEAGAQEAVTMIQAILASKKTHNNNNGNYGGGGGGGGGGAQITIQVMIPDKDVGLCIGRQGCVIKEMQNQSRTRIQIPGQPTPGQAHRIATVSGPPDACEQVRQMIERIVMEQSSASVMSGTPGGGGGGGGPGGHYNQQYGGGHQQQGYHQGGYHGGQQQQQQGGAAGGQDYSAEWAAYYAAQQQAAQQQPVAAPAPAPVVAAPAAAAPAPGPASDAYHEEFFRYAYYYGEPAARQYYGAWSPPVGTANPYGVNPNGVTAPPAGAPGPAPAAAAAPSPNAVAAAAAAALAAVPAAAAPAPARTGRETSVRKVSNLPAWMTRGQG